MEQIKLENLGVWKKSALLALYKCLCLGAEEDDDGDCNGCAYYGRQNCVESLYRDIAREFELNDSVPASKNDEDEYPDTNEGVKTDKPPIGIKPRRIHDFQRLTELFAAVLRYMEAEKKVPGEWVDEIRDLINVYDREVESVY